MSGTDAPDRAPRTLFQFRTQADVDGFATGCDADDGSGRSSVHFDLASDPAVDAGVRANGGVPYARFWGAMSTAVRPGLEKRVRGGYAGVRNKVRGRGVYD
jgi:NADH dehydrogenase [ubiquinone] 1 alpha subcomplex assembly factor 1